MKESKPRQRRTQAKSPKGIEYLTILKNGWPITYKLQGDKLELISIEWKTGDVPIDNFKLQARQKYEAEVRNNITYDWLNFQ